MRRLAAVASALFAAFSLLAQEPYAELGAKLDQYFVALAGESADVQNAECDFLISSCKDSLVRQYVTLKIYNHYRSSGIMGDEAVAVHIADEWLIPGKVAMPSGEELLAAKMFATFNRSSLIGCEAPVLTLFSPEGEGVRVPSRGRYSVLYFYDTGCATCKRETGRLKEFSEEGEYADVEVFAVYVGSSKEEWDAYREGFEGVTHLWDPEITSDWQLKYGVLGTPRMFLVSPSGTVLGRGLDTPALKVLLNKEFSKEEYVYGEQGEMERLSRLFSVYGDTLKVADIMDVADYMAARTFGEGDIDSFKQVMGDMLYYLFSRREEVYRDAAIPFIEKFIALPEVWNTEADRAQVSSLADLLSELSSRTPVGTQVPDFEVPGTLRRKPCLFSRGRKEGRFGLRSLKGNPGYVVFYTGGCNACRETMEAVDALVEKDRKVRVLLVDMDGLMASDPAFGEQLLDSFDLSVLPFVIQLDKKGIVQHRYVQL